MTLKCNGWPQKAINRAPLLYYVKLCASFQIYRWIQTGDTVRKRLTRVKSGDFFVPCDPEIWCMTLENKGEFQSEKWIQTAVTAQKRSIQAQIVDFFVHVTLKFDKWHWKTLRDKIDDYFVSSDLKIWQMTLKNNRPPLLCYFKLCASFCIHWWNQIGVAVRKCPIWVKIVFPAVWPWNLTDDLEKQ